MKGIDPLYLSHSKGKPPLAHAGEMKPPLFEIDRKTAVRMGTLHSISIRGFQAQNRTYEKRLGGDPRALLFYASRAITSILTCAGKPFGNQ